MILQLNDFMGSLSSLLLLSLVCLYYKQSLYLCADINIVSVEIIGHL